MDTTKHQKHMISPKEEELKTQKKPGEKIFDKEKRRFKKGVTKR